jgi:hypothetical protein
MARLNKFLPGDGIALTSISVHIDGLLRPKQFFFSRKRHWFSERGHEVSIERIPSRTTARNLLKDSPDGSAASLRDCHSPAFV